MSVVFPDFAGRGEPVSASCDELLLLVAQGDVAAYEILYRREMPSVLHTVMSVLRDRAQAEEVAQETMLKIWQCAGQFNPFLGAGRPWMLRIARSKAVDRVRLCVNTRDRDRTHMRLHLDAGSDVVTETVLSLVDRQRVQMALLEISAVQREALVLAFFSPLSYPQIAVTLGIALGTLKTRIRDGLRKLRPLLAEQSGADDAASVAAA